MFKLMFTVLQDVSRRPIYFSHIHGGEQGIRTVTVDMCNKQGPGEYILGIYIVYADFLGFGDFLHSLDKAKRWEEHLQHMVVFCRVHVKRNFAKEWPKHTVRHSIDIIWQQETQDGLFQHMNNICEVYPELKKWINHKRTPWILAGLTKELSKVPEAWWTFARKHTGISESSHFSDNNYTGRALSLLNAVLR